MVPECVTTVAAWQCFVKEDPNWVDIAKYLFVGMQCERGLVASSFCDYGSL